MSKTLEERLRDAKAELGKIDGALLRHTGKVPSEVGDQFRTVTAFAADIEYWIGMLAARSAARLLLTGLEAQADGNDTVPLGAARAKYQHVRLIGVQAYLATKWALADRLVGMVGRVVCTPEAGFDASRPAQLVAQFVQKERKKNTAAALYDSVRQTFGWPIAVSYALRNHFVHDGGQFSGTDVFDGPTAASRFAISVDGSYFPHVLDLISRNFGPPGHPGIAPFSPEEKYAAGERPSRRSTVRCSSVRSS
jgi:hypothetical protein